jgi:homoserine O-acetyltransferase
MTDEGSVGIVETQTYTFAEHPHEMELESGRKLGPITLAYETYGTLNADKSNAVLILHALSGDAHAAGRHREDDRDPGWWDMMIGPGKGFDTNKYFVICSNVIGGCRGSTGPASINPETGKPYGLSFPIITIGDMVRAQRHLVDHLEIDRLLSIAGGSMGGMQVLEWITRYPERVGSAMVIASTPLLSAQAIAFDAVGRHAIQADGKFQDGDYYGEAPPATGLGIARMLGHITYLSDQSMGEKFGRDLRSTDAYSYDFRKEFSVETYLDYKGEQFVNRFDANSYLYLTKAIDYFDVAEPHGSLDAAMQRAEGKLMVLSYTSDWLYPPYQSQSIVHALMRKKKDVTYCNIESPYGHDAFLIETGTMKKLIEGFLTHVDHPEDTIGSTGDEVYSASDLDNPPTTPENIYEGHRVDYEMITNLVREKSRVLDVGCGDGALLAKLVHEKDVAGMGIEVSQRNIVACVRRGISVVQADINEGLNTIPDQSYDYVILSMTLQVIEKPDIALHEMVRVGRRCIVSFPNFAHWSVRREMLIHGRAPVTTTLPYSWHESPNRAVLSIKDFREYCAKQDIYIEQEIPLSSRGHRLPAKIWPNAFADEAVFVISAQERGHAMRGVSIP